MLSLVYSFSCWNKHIKQQFWSLSLSSKGHYLFIFSLVKKYIRLNFWRNTCIFIWPLQGHLSWNLPALEDNNLKVILRLQAHSKDFPTNTLSVLFCFFLHNSKGLKTKSVKVRWFVLAFPRKFIGPVRSGGSALWQSDAGWFYPSLFLLLFRCLYSIPLERRV